MTQNNTTSYVDKLQRTSHQITVEEEVKVDAKDKKEEDAKIETEGETEQPKEPEVNGDTNKV